MLNKAMHKTRLTQNNFTSWAHMIRPWPCVLHIYSSSPPLKLSSGSSIRVKFQGQKNGLYKTWVAFGLHVVRGVLCLAFPSFFFFFLDARGLHGIPCTMHCSGNTMHCLGDTMHCSMGSMHCSWDPQSPYSGKNIKNESHDIIHIFKNYFAIVFSVFSKISGIQIDPLQLVNVLLKNFDNILRLELRSGKQYSSQT